MVPHPSLTPAGGGIDGVSVLGLWNHGDSVCGVLARLHENLLRV